MNAENRPPIDVASDEDWKSRVKEEDAKRDAASGGEQQQIPPATFASLAQLLASQAVAALGLIPGPSGKTKIELPIARHFVDLLGVLEEKTRGNLSPQEAKAMEHTLHDLRMAYISVSQNPPPKS